MHCCRIMYKCVRCLRSFMFSFSDDDYATQLRDLSLGIWFSFLWIIKTVIGTHTAAGSHIYREVIVCRFNEEQHSNFTKIKSRRTYMSKIVCLQVDKSTLGSTNSKNRSESKSLNNIYNSAFHPGCYSIHRSGRKLKQMYKNYDWFRLARPWPFSYGINGNIF